MKISMRNNLGSIGNENKNRNIKVINTTTSSPYTLPDDAKKIISIFLIGDSGYEAYITIKWNNVDILNMGGVVIRQSGSFDSRRSPYTMFIDTNNFMKLDISKNITFVGGTKLVICYE